MVKEARLKIYSDRGVEKISGSLHDSEKGIMKGFNVPLKKRRD